MRGVDPESGKAFDHTCTRCGAPVCGDCAERHSSREGTVDCLRTALRVVGPEAFEAWLFCHGVADLVAARAVEASSR
jgi:hypothetical protein